MRVFCLFVCFFAGFFGVELSLELILMYKVYIHPFYSSEYHLLKYTSFSQWLEIQSFFFFKDFIYSTEIETARERGNTSRGSGRGKSRLIAEEPDVGPNPITLG